MVDWGLLSFIEKRKKKENTVSGPVFLNMLVKVFIKLRFRLELHLIGRTLNFNA